VQRDPEGGAAPRLQLWFLSFFLFWVFCCAMMAVVVKLLESGWSGGGQKRAGGRGEWRREERNKAWLPRAKAERADENPLRGAIDHIACRGAGERTRGVPSGEYGSWRKRELYAGGSADVGVCNARPGDPRGVASRKWFGEALREAPWLAKCCS